MDFFKVFLMLEISYTWRAYRNLRFETPDCVSCGSLLNWTKRPALLL